MAVVQILPHWRDAYCTECGEKFYLHFWGMGHDHVCKPQTKAQIEAMIEKEVSKRFAEKTLTETKGD
jgi:hypothetical protein